MQHRPGSADSASNGIHKPLADGGSVAVIALEPSTTPVGSNFVIDAVPITPQSREPLFPSTISLWPTSGPLLVVPVRHYMQTRRNVTTYKSRNRRKRDQDEKLNHILTSPLSEIDKDGTTISEMNCRMRK